MLLTLALVTALFRPAQPTVGDRITIDFPATVRLDASKDYDIVAQNGGRVIIRCFKPKPVPLGGAMGGVRFANLMLPMRSVLVPNDSMKPAPLRPPLADGFPRAIGWALLAAALLAAGLWLAAWLRSRGFAFGAAPQRIVPPAEAFEAAVRAAAASRQKWAALADATRTYLGARGVGRDLTTSQLLAEIPQFLIDAPEELRRHHLETVGEILRRGDLEKFSPWGPPAGEFQSWSARALELVPQFEPPPPAEEAA